MTPGIITGIISGIVSERVPDLPHTAVYTLSAVEAVVSFLIATSLVLVGIYCMIIFATTLLPKVIIVGVIPFAADIAVFNGIFDVCTAMSGRGEIKSTVGLLIANMPSNMRLSLLFLLMLSGILRLRAVQRTVKSSVTEFSIGEALDSLPMGIAFTGKNSMVLQSNHVIHDICYRTVGMTMTDGDMVWDRISTGKVRPGMIYQGGEKPMITTPDGKVWIFRKDSVHSRTADFDQITAVDATREQQIVQELEEKTEQLADMNRRLRSYNDIVDDTIRREELLAAKMRVHDNMGEVLLATKILINNEKGPATPEGVLQAWRRDLNLLREEAKDEKEPTQIDRLIEAGDHLGIKLELTGDIPEDFDIMNLICVGIQECMTNALQHADSDHMYVTINKTDTEYEVIYKNNGKIPTYPIKEGGGLSILRQTAAKMNADMEYVGNGEFTLVLHIPVGGGKPHGIVKAS